MHFSTPPKVSLLRALFRRRADPSAGLPRLEASADRVSLAAGPYSAVCGYSGEGVPLTWPDVACRGLQFAVMTSPAFPFRLPGLVHVHQRIERAAPLSATDTPSARVFVDRLRPARRGVEFELVTELSNAGRVVWRGVSVLLSKDVPGDGVRREENLAPLVPEFTERWSLASRLGREYARVSGDYNPIHLTALTARLFGYSRPIVHGWWSAARCLAALGERIPTRCVVEVAFRKTVPLPSDVVFMRQTVGATERFALLREEPCVTGQVTKLEGPISTERAAE